LLALQEMVNYYYDLATDFYEYGWGDSFHFAHRFSTESLRESILRHEYYLASQLGLKPGQTCMDLGCGVGGPARNIARFSGAKITGLNNNAYQVKRATLKTEREGLTSLVKFVKVRNAGKRLRPNTAPLGEDRVAYGHSPYYPRCPAAYTLPFLLLQGDFMNLPFKPESFDAAYAIEATCHAPDRTACFTQIFKALKPGGTFAGCVRARGQRRRRARGE
jgi:sterol 24-C-methyltransferase